MGQFVLTVAYVRRSKNKVIKGVTTVTVQTCLWLLNSPIFTEHKHVYISIQQTVNMMHKQSLMALFAKNIINAKYNTFIMCI